MSDLKTLKEIEEIFSPMKRVYGGEDLISANIIREEAKNWIQELSKVYADREGVVDTAIIMDNNAKIGWINQFFNLEEEK